MDHNAIMLHNHLLGAAEIVHKLRTRPMTATGRSFMLGLLRNRIEGASRELSAILARPPIFWPWVR